MIKSINKDHEKTDFKELRELCDNGEDRLKIYIAAPYTPKDCSLHDASRESHHNVQDAISIAEEIIAKGHFPIIPHLSHYVFINTSVEVPDVYWYELGLAKLEDCDAIYCSSDSRGVKMERRVANEAGIPIISSLSNLQPYEGDDDE